MKKLLLALLAAASCVFVSSCNETPLTPLGDTLFATTNDLSDPIGSNKVDILWLIDNSQSMQEEQAELAARFDEFIEALVVLRADFHIGVITTDMQSASESGRLQTRPGLVFGAQGRLEVPAELQALCADLNLERPFLTRSRYVIGDDELDVERLRNDFRCIASAGIAGSPFERGIDALVRALSPELLDGFNQGFVRDDAYLSIIFLTDEDDCSFGGAFTPTSDAECYIRETRGLMVPAEDVFEQLVALKNGDESKVLIAGIIGPDGNRELQPRAQYEPRFSCAVRGPTDVAGAPAISARDGIRYRELIALAGDRGIEESICQGDFTLALRKIGEVLRRSLDFNCLRRQPERCNSDRDCAPGVTCINPGNPGSGDRFCADFEIFIEVNTLGQPGVFTPLRSPGPATLVVPNPDAQYLINYDSLECVVGVSFQFVPGNRPPSGTRYRASYPIEVDVITVQ
jgi:hypothetical protein